jgi:carboxymethylenebutenolidase
MIRSLPIIVFLAVGLLICTVPSAPAQDRPAQPSPAIPADADGAQKALTDSPRHGEWQEIELPGSDVKIKTWVVYPERSGEAPVVIVIHEIFGLTDWVRAVADQLAAEGFVAVAPDLLSGKGPGGGGTESFEGDSVRAAIQGLSGPELESRLNAVRDWAIGLDSTSDKTATIGFCWGGSTSFAYATRQPALNAAVVYYGTSPREPQSFAAVKAPVLGLYGGDDARVTSTVPATEEAMKNAGKEFTHHVYEGAGHGFLRQQSGKEGANQRAAEQAWKETIDFLKKHLEAPSEAARER